MPPGGVLVSGKPDMHIGKTCNGNARDCAYQPKCKVTWTANFNGTGKPCCGKKTHPWTLVWLRDPVKNGIPGRYVKWKVEKFNDENKETRAAFRKAHNLKEDTHPWVPAFAGQVI